MIRLQVALCLILSLFFLACSKEENKTTGITCDGSNLTYNSGIASIINSNCTSSNCHGNNSSVGDFTSYNGLKTVINNGQFNSTVLVSKSMPRGSKLSDSQLSKLKCWVDNGYPEKMKEKKRTLILGASPNPDRYAYKATVSLHQKGHPVFPVGLRQGLIHNIEILTNNPVIEEIDTVTLYVGPKNQPVYYDYIIHQIKPKRIIFNPGTENQELMDLAAANGIENEVACTLVLLSINSY